MKIKKIFLIIVLSLLILSLLSVWLLEKSCFFIGDSNKLLILNKNLDGEYGLIIKNNYETTVVSDDFIKIFLNNSYFFYRFSEVFYNDGKIHAVKLINDSFFMLNITLEISKLDINNDFVFKFNYSVKNLGKSLYNISFPVSFRLFQDVNDSYYFSPGIFYKNNSLMGDSDAFSNYPKLSRLINESYFTFLANRPMLPLIGNWYNNKYSLLFTTDFIKINNSLVRNSMGWFVNDSISQNIWTHGYLYNRYTAPGVWSGVINGGTDKKDSLLSNESFNLVFYIDVRTGSILDFFESIKKVRTFYSFNQVQLIYEGFNSSLKRKMKNIGLFYRDEGYFAEYVHSNKYISSWVGGIPESLGFLYLADYFENNTMRNFSINSINFFTNNSLSPSGLSYPYFEDGIWNYAGWWFNRMEHKGIPSRLVSEAIYYLIEAYNYELSLGFNHTDWFDVIKSNINYMSNIWGKNNDFGYELSDVNNEIVISGTSSGVLWIANLAMFYNITKDESYLLNAERAANYYFDFVRKGTLFGCELDQEFGPDASCAAHAMTAFLTLYEVTKNETYLNYAKHSANIFSTFVVGYNMFFNDSQVAGVKNWTSLGLTTSGVRNNHITSGCWPGFTKELYKIGIYSNDSFYLDLANEIFNASLEMYALNDSDLLGVIGGFGFDQLSHSDWSGGTGEDPSFWFGGLVYPNYAHQIYIPSLNLIPLDFW